VERRKSGRVPPSIDVSTLAMLRLRARATALACRAKRATVDRELAIVRRAFRLKLKRFYVPDIPMLSEKGNEPSGLSKLRSSTRSSRICPTTSMRPCDSCL